MNPLNKVKVWFARWISAYIATVKLLFANTVKTVKVVNANKSFSRCTKAKVSIAAIIGLVLAVTVAAYTIPDALTAMTIGGDNMTTAGVPASVVTLFATVGSIVVVVVFLLMLIRSGGSD